MRSAPTVFLVDDDADVLKAHARILRSADFAVIAFDSPETFLEACTRQHPGCIVLDLAMPGLDGLSVQRTLAERGCNQPIVFLSGRGDVPVTVRAMKQGALDFLTKPVDAEELIAAVRGALERDREARAADAQIDELRARLATLTPREFEVMQHVVSGQLNKQIAAELGTVEKTIKVHRSRVMEKMCVRSLAELVRLAQRLGVEARGRRSTAPA